MRVLVTGSQGFVGRHMIGELRKAGMTVGAFDMAKADSQCSGLEYYQGDIQDQKAVAQAVRKFKPEACIHLGGLTFVPEGWTNTEKLFSVNSLGTINLLEALRQHSPAAVILVVSSSEIYGRPYGINHSDENSPLSPDNPYAVSKAAADSVTLLYARQYSMRAMVARPSNHIGPGQSLNFAVPSFAAQLGAIAAKKCPPAMKVGNLDSKRDFTDVRDVVRAYKLLIEKGRGGEAYNIASGREISLRVILEKLCDIFKVNPEIEVAKERYRRPEPRPVLNTAKIEKEIGWKPEIDIMETTLRDIAAELIK